MAYIMIGHGVSGYFGTGLAPTATILLGREVQVGNPRDVGNIIFAEWRPLVTIWRPVTP